MPTLFSVFENPNRSDQGLCHGGPLKVPIISVMPDSEYHAEQDPDVMGYLYLDGHVRVYSGKRDLQKTHVTRTRIAAPATVETWATDQRGDPVFVVTSELSASLVSEIRRLLPGLNCCWSCNPGSGHVCFL